jgi:hypothetical protein
LSGLPVDSPGEKDSSGRPSLGLPSSKHIMG